jgi:hypothetical protein
MTLSHVKIPYESIGVFHKMGRTDCVEVLCHHIYWTASWARISCWSLLGMRVEVLGRPNTLYSVVVSQDKV